MIADIKQVEKGYIARYERHIEHPIEHVWAMLTDNENWKSGFKSYVLEILARVDS